MHVKKHIVISLSGAVLLTLISTLSYGADTGKSNTKDMETIKGADEDCNSPCVPFSVETTEGTPNILTYQVEYFDCKKKIKVTPRLYQEGSFAKKDVGHYCAVPNTEIRVEQVLVGGTKNAWPPIPVGKGWDITCGGMAFEPKCTGKSR